MTEDEYRLAVAAAVEQRNRRVAKMVEAGENEYSAARYAEIGQAFMEGMGDKGYDTVTELSAHNGAHKITNHYANNPDEMANLKKISDPQRRHAEYARVSNRLGIRTDGPMTAEPDYMRQESGKVRYEDWQRGGAAQDNLSDEQWFSEAPRHQAEHSRRKGRY
jgi:hypothetical protein